MRGQLIRERDVAVGTLTEILPINPNLAVAIHAIKLDKDQLSFRSHRNSERLAIPTQPARQGAATSPRRRVFTKFAFDAPIVRQIELAPLLIVQPRVLSISDVTEMKPPTLIERDSFIRPRIRERC